MAAGDPKFVIITSDPLTTLAAANTAFQTAVTTFLANAGGAVWLPQSAGGITPQCIQCGITIVPDAAVANDKFICWAGYSYVSSN